MSMNSIPLSDLQSSPSAKFENIGDTYRGRITAMSQKPQTDPKTGQVKTFVDGTVRQNWVITIEQANGESVSLWAKGGTFRIASGSGESMLFAIGSAVRAAGASAVEIGAELAVAHTGMGVPEPGLNAPRLFTAQYRPPREQPVAVPVDLFND